MNVNARRCASLALALLLAATLVPAHGLAKTKADATANNTTAESAEDTDAVSASTDTTVDSDADDTESTTDTDKKSKKVKEPVTIVSSNLAYRVRTATTWGEYVDSGGQAGTADRRATGQIGRAHV